MDSLFDLTNKTALITGGNKGLGREIAGVLARYGATPIIVSRHQDELEEALREITQNLEGKGAFIAGDLTDRADVERIAHAALAVNGSIDILINNAGSNDPQLITDLKDETFDGLIELNLRAPAALVRAIAPSMMAKKWGRIINVSSIMASAPLEGRTVYAASKGALESVTRVWARELGTFGITVNCIVPGPFLTELPARVLTEEQKSFFTNHTVLKRWGKPSEIAGPVLMLVSEAGSYITGECLRIDGGYLSL